MADVEKFLRQASPENEGSIIGRRRLLWLAGGVASTFLLPGCGSGHSGSSPVPGAPLITPTPITPTPSPSSPAPTPSPTPVAIPDPIVFTSADRLEPSGDLANQINQFSEAANALSLSYAGSAQTVADLQSYLAGTRAFNKASRQEAPETGVGLQTISTAVRYTLPALLSTYEQAVSASLFLDQVAYLGDKVTANSGLQGVAAVSNPQWVAAMMERNYHIITVLEGCIRFYQTMGLQELASVVESQSDPDIRIAVYYVVADVFNEWVGRMAAQVGVAVKPEWLLDTSNSISADETLGQVARIPDLILAVPHGPGYRSDTTKSIHRGRDQEDDDIATYFGYYASGLGALGKILVKEGSNSKVNPAIIGKVLAGVVGGNGPGLSNLQGYVVGKITDSLEEEFPNGGPLASCAIKLGVGAINTLASAFAALETGVTGIGLIFFGAQTVINLGTTIYTAYDCAGKIADALFSDPLASAAALEKTGNTGIPKQNISVLTNPSRAECDQLSSSGVRKAQITLPSSNTAPSASLTDSPSVSRAILAGSVTGATRATGDAPRTFANIQIAVASLLVNHANRNPNTVQANVSGNTLSFYASDLAVLVRREAGSTMATFPAITNADLLCTSPGFLPSRSDAPKDLTNLASLPALRPAINGVGTGVTFGVK